MSGTGDDREEELYTESPAALGGVDSRTGPISEAEVRLYNAKRPTYDTTAGGGIPEIDGRWGRERARAALGLPKEMPDE